MMNDWYEDTIEIRRQQKDIFKVLQGKNKTVNSYPEKIPLTNKDE